MTGSSLARGALAALTASRSRLAAAWALAALLALGALAEGPGVSRDEATILARAAGTSAAAGAATPLAVTVASAAGTAGASAPGGAATPLAVVAARATGSAAGTAGLSKLRALRLGSVLAGALLAALAALLAWELAGPFAALLAPALFFLAPRHLHAGLVATPDVALAALALAAVVAWRRATSAERGARLWAAAAAGLLVGAAIAARADAWVLLPAFAAHALGLRLLERPQADGARARSGPGTALLVTTALAGGIAVLAWPGVLRGELAPWLPARAGPVPAPALPLLALPPTLLLAYLGGVGHAASRVARAFRARAPRPAAADDVLLLAAAAAALAGAELAAAPAGARAALHAMPFLAVLGARALLRGCELAWPRRAGPLAATVALLVLLPAGRATFRAYPLGTAAWNELVGGAPGAASRGLPRQDGGDATLALLPALNERARAGARIWWPATPASALALHQRDGRLRSDLALARGPQDADLVVVALGEDGRDAEYRAWSALRSARPVAGVYADEVPLAFVYAAPGAWR